jgi:hypothetical protein
MDASNLTDGRSARVLSWHASRQKPLVFLALQKERRAEALFIRQESQDSLGK